jgi:hypothetical protein
MPVIVIRKTINGLGARQFKDAMQETGNVEQTVQSGLPFLVFQQAVPFLFVPVFSYRFSVEATGWVRGAASGTDTWRAVYSIDRIGQSFPAAQSEFDKEPHVVQTFLFFLMGKWGLVKG